MPFSGWLSRFRPSMEYEKLHAPLEEPVRRICRVKEPVGQKTEPSHAHDQLKDDAPGHVDHKVFNQKACHKKGHAFGELEEGLPRFGPIFGEDSDAMKNLKSEVWDHVVNEIPNEEEASIFYNYHLAIKRVEKQARDAYDPEVVKPLKKSQFREMMITDGCLFLQLALYILGGSELLGYPEKHIYFGRKGKDSNDIKRWIDAMYFVGNQIPCVVINELVKQRFFMNVINKRTWNPTSTLPHFTLYLVAVQPALGKNSGWRCFREAPPLDLLHALQVLVVVGYRNDPHHSLNWETEDNLDSDLESGLEELDKKSKFLSASEIRESGIRLRKADWGVRQLHFTKKFGLLGYLYVPPFTFDEDTETVLKHLKHYESMQQQYQSRSSCKREVAAYLRFMSDLIQMPKDISILEDKGIIKVQKVDHKEKLLRLLSKDAPSGDVPFTHNLRLTRLRVMEYRRPPYYLISWALIFTVIQTLFTTLQYFQSCK